MSVKQWHQTHPLEKLTPATKVETPPNKNQSCSTIIMAPAREYFLSLS